MRIWMMLACVAAAVLMAHPAHAQTQVKVLGTWPVGNTVTLGRNQNFYLHLSYTSDVPMHIWVQPYFDGEPVKAGSNTSRTYPAGSGEALGWFFLFDPGAQVDAVKISAGDGSTHGTPIVANYPVTVDGSDTPATSPAQPEWLTRLRAADKAAQDAAYRNAMSQPISVSDMFLFNGFMLLMAAIGLLGFAGPTWGLWRWRGGWRIAAVVPAMVMAFVVLRLVTGTAIDPTSHNLWPFEILHAGVISIGMMLALVIARLVTRAGRTS